MVNGEWAIIVNSPFTIHHSQLTIHETYMQRCLDLAKQGIGHVAPNPMVGAVLLCDDRIIGEGYHHEYGQAHAEVNCINSVKDADKALISKSTLYVSLEPCVHYGKTPPCTDLIIQNKIPVVVIGCRDSYKEVNGKGIEKLRAAGIDVTVGILEKESGELNKRFFTFYEQHRPYIILKWAQSKNGMIANADHSRVLISNEQTNRLVHKWRSEEASILVGTNTALHDDPSLTTRLWPGNDPVRVVIDMELKLPATLKLFDGKVKTIVFNKVKQDEGKMLSYHKLRSEENVIPELLEILYQQKIQSALVEGGAKVLQSFIDTNNWDEARIITNQEVEIRNGIKSPVLKNELLVDKLNILDDVINFYVKK